MNESVDLIARHAVARARSSAGHYPPTQIWLWGYGKRPSLPSFHSLYNVKGAMISAVDLLRSIGVYSGMDLIEVPGITGYIDTNYAGKGQAAIEALKTHDLVVVHVEATDESSHEGNVKAKVKALEDIDGKILGPVMAWLQAHTPYRILVAPDHPTFCATKAHSKDPVPYVLSGVGIPYTGAVSFTEAEARTHNRLMPEGYTLMHRIMHPPTSRNC
jgi:2,3-bisphosphoglycerate-independent phosphoglycerate mutase